MDPHRDAHRDAPRLAFACCWERSAFPWLMTWEENRARAHAPWGDGTPGGGRTLARGLEFSSYAFATSRRDNVARGELLGQPCFEWLDAHEERATTFYLTLQVVDPATMGATAQSGPALCGKSEKTTKKA